MKRPRSLIQQKQLEGGGPFKTQRIQRQRMMQAGKLRFLYVARAHVFQLLRDSQTQLQRSPGLELVLVWPAPSACSLLSLLPLASPSPPRSPRPSRRHLTNDTQACI